MPLIRFGETFYPANTGSIGVSIPTSGNHCGTGNCPIDHQVALACKPGVRKPAPALAQADHVKQIVIPSVSMPIGNAAIVIFGA
jgi:hypothetical protein